MEYIEIQQQTPSAYSEHLLAVKGFFRLLQIYAANRYTVLKANQKTR